MQKIIQLHNVYKSYSKGSQSQNVLYDINISISNGEFVSIVGPSGNGKSTLLNLLTGIDHPSSGKVIVKGETLNHLNSRKLTAWRSRNVGIVFQFFQLLPTLNLVQNVVLPMDFLGMLSKKQRKQRALHLLALVGLQDQAFRLPSQISGGQQQRTAIARALANDPDIIVADEPTGNLDETTADTVLQIFKQLNHQGKTLIIVTHDQSLANNASTKLEIHSGRIYPASTIKQ